MKDLTLKFPDRADFSAFMESTGYYDDELMQDDILIDVIGNVYKETGELTEDGEPVCVKEDGYFVNVRIINDSQISSLFDEYVVAVEWICPYISRHLLSLNPLLACCRRYSRGER